MNIFGHLFDGIAIGCRHIGEALKEYQRVKALPNLSDAESTKVDQEFIDLQIALDEPLIRLAGENSTQIATDLLINHDPWHAANDLRNQTITRWKTLN